MQDNQIIPLFEKLSKLTEPKIIYQTTQQILNRITPNDLQYILEKIFQCLQSNDCNVAINYSLLLKLLKGKFQTNEIVSESSLFNQLQTTLSKKKAYGKSEYKHFILNKYLVYSYLDYQNLLQTILNDRKEEDSEYLTYILLKHIKSENVKTISNAIKNELQNLTPRVFCILVKLQQLNQGQFQWDKFLHEQIFDRQKFKKLIEQSIEEYPKKQLFYQYVIQYLKQFDNTKDSQTIFNEFWQYLLQEEELKKGNYIILQFLKYFIKQTNLSLQYIKIQGLIEIWYKQFGSQVQIMRKLANTIEKSLSKKQICFDDIIYFRSIYGNRIHPNNQFAINIFSKFNEQEIENYFNTMAQLQQQTTDPQEKLYYLNEIYVLSIICETNLKLFGQMMKFIYEQGCDNFDNTYDQLDEQSKEAYPYEELKKKFIELSQSYFQSMAGKIVKNQQQFSELVKIIIKLLKKKQLIEKLKQITSNSPSQSLQHLVNAIIIFTILFEQEGLQILDEIVNVSADLSEQEPKLKKKVKQNQEKAKIVLTEIFIQLLTKSPQYLREAINQCCKQLDFTPECIEILLEVLLKEDHEYIMEMQQQELGEENQEEQSQENNE